MQTQAVLSCRTQQSHPPFASQEKEALQGGLWQAAGRAGPESEQLPLFAGGAAFAWQYHHLFSTLHVPSQSWQRNNIALTLIQLCVGVVWSCHGWCYGVSMVLCIHRPLGLWCCTLLSLLCGACFSAHLHCAASAHLKPRTLGCTLVQGRES